MGPDGKQAIGTAGGKAPKWDFLGGIIKKGGEEYFNSSKPYDYDGKYGTPYPKFPTWTSRGYKNFINWSLFELRRTGWGSGQPTGNFIKDGKYYGAKPEKKGNVNVAIVNGKPDIVWGNSLFSSGITPKPTVSLAAGGSRDIIENMKNTNDSSTDGRGYPFIGRVKLKNNTKTFIIGCGGGGATPSIIADTLIGHFSAKGGFIERCAVGDGGGSAAMVVGGATIFGGGRAFPILIYW